MIDYALGGNWKL